MPVWLILRALRRKSDCTTWSVSGSIDWPLFPPSCTTLAMTHMWSIFKNIGDIALGEMPKPILIKKDSHGETTIEEVKGA